MENLVILKENAVIGVLIVLPQDPIQEILQKAEAEVLIDIKEKSIIILSSYFLIILILFSILVHLLLVPLPIHKKKNSLDYYI